MVAIVTGADDRLFAPSPMSVVTGSAAVVANVLVPVDTTSGPVTITLPSAPADGAVAVVLMVAQGGSHAVTVATAGTDVFNLAGGATSYTISTVATGAWWQYNLAAGIWYEIANITSLSGGGSGVTSFNTRTGAVVSVSGDYSFGEISGTASIAQGGTGQTGATSAFNALSPSTTLGDLLSNDGTNDVRVAGNTTATRKFLRQTGTGSASALPAWDTLVAADVPTLNQNTTGTAAGLSSTLAIASGGTGATTQAAALAAITGSSTLGNLVSDLNNATTHSASATLNPGEETVFTGSTASQTLTLPSSTNAVASSINTVTNTATVSVTVAGGTGTTVSNFGTTGSIVIPAGYAFSFVYIGTTWYVTQAGPSDFAKSNVLSVPNGGTGSATQNFVDLTTAQNVGGVKTFTSRPVLPAPPSYSAFAPVASTGSTTITGVNVLTTLASGLTVPASGLAAGQLYRFKAWGSLTTTSDTQTFTIGLYWGGITGTLLLSWGASEPSGTSTETGASWLADFDIVANSATSLAVTGWDGLAYYFTSETQGTTTVANSSAEQFVIGVTPSSSAETMVCGGFYCIRLA